MSGVSVRVREFVLGGLVKRQKKRSALPTRAITDQVETPKARSTAPRIARRGTRPQKLYGAGRPGGVSECGEKQSRRLTTTKQRRSALVRSRDVLPSGDVTVV